MLKTGIVGMLIVGILFISGCSSNNDSQVLKKENEDLKIRLSKYEKVETNIQTNNTQKQEEVFENPPVELKSIEFDKSGVTGVNVIFKNNSPKTVDAIEFVILQFDNLGRPAYRFNDSSHGNVTGELLMQGTAKENGTIKGGWTLFNADKTTKGKIVVKQVHYTDNSLWVNQKFTEQVKKEQDKL